MSRNQLLKYLFVAEALPATNDAAGFQALTWVRANGYLGGVQLGVPNEGVTVPTGVETGLNKVLKGAGTGQASTLTFDRIAADAGQLDVIGLATTSATGNGSIKIVTVATAGASVTAGDPVQYAQGVFHSYVENAIEAGNYEGFSVVFQQNAHAVNSTEPA